MIYRQDIDDCLSRSADDSRLSPDRFTELAGSLADGLKDLKEGSRPEVQAIIDEVNDGTALETLEPVAERYSESFDDVVVLGTGGSSLGGRTMCRLASSNSPNQPRLHFMDNVDPVSFEALFQSVTPERTGFLVVSKSGGTMETMAQFLHCLDVFRNALGGGAASRHFTAICEPGSRPLRDISDYHGIQVLDHPPLIGGRFSALSITGMLPAMIAGLDVDGVRDGAGQVIAGMAGASTPEDCPPAVGAAINVGLALEKRISQTVVMPYLDRMAGFGKWFRQLWAESLGKDGKGTTPVDALGAVDQHSQFQLYLDGPRDKFFTLIGADAPGRGGDIPAEIPAGTGLDYLAGKRLGDLLIAEQAATADVLAESGCPVRTLSINGLDERAMGALMMHFILETILAADLLGVSPFGQPAVENGKVLARKYLAEGTSS